MDLYYLRLTFLLLFFEENSCSINRYYQCTLHKKLFFKLSDQKDSEKMICWESQLLDSTRILLTEKYNDYRGDVARGTCPRCNANEKYQYMCEMKWHWILEKKAQQLLQKRNFSKQLASLSMNDIFSADSGELGYRFLETKYWEYATTSFLLDKLVDVEQISYVKKFLNYLNETNILHDWAVHFRRQFVTFFGCSMAVIDVIKAEYSAYTALDEKIEDGDKVLLMACVFASPTQNELADASNETHNYPPTLESCNTMNSSTRVSVNVKNCLCSFEDQTDAMAIFTPCQVYYPHPYFSDMVPCPGDIPDHWTGSTLLEESNYSEILIHFSDRAKLSFALKSSRTNTAEQLTTSPSPALFGEPLEALLIPRTTKSSIFEQLDSSDENSLSDAFYIKWQSESERMRRADRKNKNNFLLFDPVDPDSDEFDSNFNEFDPLPDKPEKETIYLMPTPAVYPFEAKYCVVFVLFYFIIFFTFCVVLSIMAKYYVEKEYFET